MLEKTTALVCVALGAMLSTARADDDTESKPAAEATASADGGDQLTLPKGRLLLNAFLGVNLNEIGKPISLSPDIWYGVTDDITVGLVHSGVSGSGFIGVVGILLCLIGLDNGCAELYSNVGADIRYKLKNGMLAYAVDAGVFVADVNADSITLAAKLGAVARWHSGPLAVEVQPNAFIGVTNRDASVDIINLPATALYTVAPKIDVAGQTGFVLPLKDTGDTYSLPLSIGAFYHVNESLTANAAFSLPRLIAASGGGTDFRTLTLGGTYAF
jgi:hypothetical protein